MGEIRRFPLDTDGSASSFTVSQALHEATSMHEETKYDFVVVLFVKNSEDGVSSGRVRVCGGTGVESNFGLAGLLEAEKMSVLLDL